MADAWLFNRRLPLYECRQDSYLVSTDPARLDLDVVHQFLATEAYWSPGVEREKVARAMAHSLCFGLYATAATGEPQVGFARAITDCATFAYVADVFVLRPYRGRGLGQWLIRSLLAHPELQTLRKWTLNTQDAHRLYRRFGFKNDPRPENYLVFRPQDPNW